MSPFLQLNLLFLGILIGMLLIIPFINFIDRMGARKRKQRQNPREKSGTDQSQHVTAQ